MCISRIVVFVGNLPMPRFEGAEVSSDVYLPQIPRQGGRKSL
jgi:hypothetical protein